MDLMFVLVFTGVGTVVGAAVVWALMQRKSRPPVMDAELASLKESLQKSDAALAVAASRAEELGQRVSKQDQTLEENREELKARNQQLRMAMQEVEGEITRRCAAEHQMQGLSDQIAALSEQLKQSQTTSGAQTDSGAEQANQSIAALQVELEGEKRQIQELTERIAHLMEERSEQQKVTEEAIQQRTSLDGQLGAERERIQKLMDEIAELQDARLVLDARLTEERQSAVKRGELLTIAQEKVSLLFHELCADVANGRTSVDHAVASSEGSLN
jgi:chromosome segregation ATPase